MLPTPHTSPRAALAAAGTRILAVAMALVIAVLLGPLALPAEATGGSSADAPSANGNRPDHAGQPQGEPAAAAADPDGGEEGDAGQDVPPEDVPAEDDGASPATPPAADEDESPEDEAPEDAEEGADATTSTTTTGPTTSTGNAPATSNSTAVISASFTDDCTGFTATSDKDISNIEITYVDGSQKLDGLSGTSYPFDGDRVIVRIVVKSGTTSTTFSCQPAVDEAPDGGEDDGTTDGDDGTGDDDPVVTPGADDDDTDEDGPGNSEADITTAFIDCTGFTAESTKDISNIVITYVDGTTQKIEPIDAGTYEFPGNPDNPIASITVKSGTTETTFTCTDDPTTPGQDDGTTDEGDADTGDDDPVVTPGEEDDDPVVTPEEEDGSDRDDQDDVPTDEGDDDTGDDDPVVTPGDEDDATGDDQDDPDVTVGGSDDDESVGSAGGTDGDEITEGDGGSDTEAPGTAPTQPSTVTIAQGGDEIVQPQRIDAGGGGTAASSSATPMVALLVIALIGMAVPALRDGAAS